MRITASSGIKAKYDSAIEENNYILKPSRVINLFRVCQEAVNNACKYSEATEILSAFVLNENSFEVIIKDNGNGFEVDQTKGGNGLHNMKSRIAEIGGDIVIKSSNKGTTISIKLAVSEF